MSIVLVILYATPVLLLGTTESAGSGLYWVGARSTAKSAFSVSGVRATIQVVDASVTGCLSFWVAATMADNTLWAQVGYYVCEGSRPIAFYQIWKSDGIVTGTISVSTGAHQFSMYQQAGTTWAYALDGAVFGTYDMGASLSSSTYPVEVVSEESYVNSPWNPPQVQFTGIQVMNSGAWSSVPAGFEPFGCANSTYSCWGAKGNLQDSTIPPSSLVIGGNASPISAGTFLWSGSTSTPPTTTTTTTTTTTSTSTTTTTTTSTTTTTMPQDTTPPTASITTPTNGAIVSGTITVSATASDNTAVAYVEFYVDSKLKATVYTPAYSFQWNTKSVKTGQHTITAVAYDTSGNHASASVAVNVANLRG